tara:strand:- start:412 stop:1587 length:1176 start_codon:yes stop_codon:yes gene_type:complete
MLEKKLNIALLGIVTLPIPPFKGYGGTQRGIYDFLTHMDEKDHHVHLFGPGDSDVSKFGNVTLHSFIEQSLWVPENNLPIKTKKAQEKEHYQKSLERLGEIIRSEDVDIINLRSDDVDFLREVANRFGTEKIVYSLHNLRDQSRIDAIRDLGITSVAHCRNHKKQHGNLPNIKIITYGINVETYPFSQNTISQSTEILTLDVLKKLKRRGSDYLITIGNIGKNKGQKTCIELARKADIPLIIAGAPQIRESDERGTYFEEEIMAHVDGENIIYFGNADEEQKKELLRHSRGFLFPSGYEDKTWNEPFGRAPIEALSCGTPVIAYRKGSMPEIVFDSFNGFLFETKNEAVKQISSLDGINREDCRRTAVKKFNSERVANEYEKLFYEILENR